MAYGIGYDSGATSSAATVGFDSDATSTPPATPAIVKSAPNIAIGVIVSCRSVAPRTIEIGTAICEMTPTVIASTHRSENVRSSCAPIAKSDVSASGIHSLGSGLRHVAIPNGAQVKRPSKQKLV